MMFPYIALNLLSLRDVALEHRTFKVSTSRLLYLNEKVFFLDVESMIDFAKKVLYFLR